MTDNIANICFMDFETRNEPGSRCNLKTAGTYRYAREAFATILTFGIGDAPVQCRALDRGFDGDWMTWGTVPELHAFHERVLRGEAWYAAWNAGFDRTIWNQGTADFPLLKPEHIVDIMAQAVASNLPASLEGASKSIGRDGKQDDGKALIELFAYDGGGTPQSHPAQWHDFKTYATRDTAELREIFRATRPLPLAEWEDYWISEKINARGVGIDVEFARRCAAIADASRDRDNALLKRWTNGQLTAVTQVARIADYVFDRLDYNEARDMLVKEWDEDKVPVDDSAEGDLVAGKLSLNRDRIAKVLAFFDAQPQPLPDLDQVLVDILTTRQFGGSSSPGKFSKMLEQETDGRLRGMYVFNGAQQTGRFSSKGVQTHNLMRSSLGKAEVEAIEMINELEV